MGRILVGGIMPNDGMHLTKRSALLGLYNLTVINDGKKVVEFVVDSKEAAELALKILTYLEEEDSILKDSFLNRLRDKGLSILSRILNRKKAISQ